MGHTGPSGTFSCRTIVVVLALASFAPAAAWAHAGNPNFRSQVTRVEPRVAGVQFEVRNYDDRLYAINRSGKDLLVDGYDREPYIRILADGTVEVNKRSPSFYLNEDRFAEVDVPADASKDSRPRWEVVDRSGRYEWHDHRIHYMSKGTPPQVTDEDRPAKIFDWRVPIEVGAQRAVVAGTLSWEPSDSGVPVAAYFALGAIALASALLFTMSRRIRKRRTPHRGGDAW